MARWVEIAGCPCPRELAPFVREVVRRTGVAPVTIYRGDDAEALRILHANGKHSQRELYDAALRGEGWRFGIRGTPNPPGQSTHELRSDGRAFPGPVGRALPEIQCGMDWPLWAISHVKAEFAKLGCRPIHPYPGTTEAHHICCTRAGKLSPTLLLASDPLEPGDRDPLVKDVQVFMKRAGRYDGEIAEKVGTYGPVLGAIVKRWQREHDLTADGVVGPKTYAAMRRRYGWRRWLRILKRRKAARR